MKQTYLLATLLLLACIKINAQIIDVVTGLEGPTQIIVNGTDLYIPEYSGGKISKIDISAITPTATDIVTGLNFPIGLAIYGTKLYFSDLDKIVKVDLNTLSTEDVIIENSIKIYPNPSSGLFNLVSHNVKGNDISVVIFSSQGRIENKFEIETY